MLGWVPSSRAETAHAACYFKNWKYKGRDIQEDKKYWNGRRPFLSPWHDTNTQIHLSKPSWGSFWCWSWLETVHLMTTQWPVKCVWREVALKYLKLSQSSSWSERFITGWNLKGKALPLLTEYECIPSLPCRGDWLVYYVVWVRGRKRGGEIGRAWWETL